MTAKLMKAVRVHVNLSAGMRAGRLILERSGKSIKKFAATLMMTAMLLFSSCAEPQKLPETKDKLAKVKRTAARTVSGPSIEVVETEIDLGTIPYGQSEIVGEIFFFNIGDKPLQVKKVTGSCDCYMGYSGDKLLKPEEGGVLEVRFDKNKIPAGKVKRRVSVNTNDPVNGEQEVRFVFSVQRDPADEQIRLLKTELSSVRKELKAIHRDLNKVLKLVEGGSTAKARRKADTTVYDIEIGTSPVLGPDDAPVTIVEFVDFQCPYCVREYPKIKQILDKYPDDVKLVFKHFPLGSHKKARPVHAAAQLAHIQGDSELFWKMHDMIMAEPKKVDISDLREHAESLNMDLVKFDEYLADESKIDGLLRADITEAQKCKVRGTPTVFINGLKLADRSINGYKARIDKILAKSAPPDVKG